MVLKHALSQKPAVKGDGCPELHFPVANNAVARQWIGS